MQGSNRIPPPARRADAAFLESFEQAAIGIAHVAPNGVFRDVNPRLCAILGRTREALLALDFQAITHPDDLRADAGARAELIAGVIASYSREKRYLRGDGAVVWATLTVSLVRDAEGAPDHFLSIIEELPYGPRRQIEAALAVSEARFRGIFDSVYELIALLTPDGRVLEVNRAALEFGGLTAEQVIGRPIWEARFLVESADPTATPRPSNEAVVRAAAAAGGAFVRYEIPLRRADGRIANIDFSMRPVRDATGAVIFLVAEGRDITDVRRKTAELRLSEERLRLAVDAAGMGVWDGALPGQEMIWSAAVFALLGLPPDPHGRGSLELLRERIHPEDLARFNDDLADLPGGAGGEREYRLEHRVVRADTGEIRWLLAHGRVLPNTDAGPARFTGVVLDITERKRAEAAAARSAADLEALVASRTVALERAARELAAEMRRREEAQAALLQSQKLEALGQLVAGVSHDFNNLLSAIVSAFAIIERRSDAPFILDIVRRGATAAGRATRLIRQLMTFARRESLQTRPESLATALTVCRDLIAHAVGPRVRLSMTVSPDAWPVMTDLQQLEVALLNLAVNARDAMPEGGALLIAAANLPPGAAPPGLPPGDYVAITIRDEGEGMSPTVLERAMEPFFTTKRHGEGTGLGLAMVHGFASQSGGALRLDSREGGGTTATLVLPRALGASDPQANGCEEGGAPTTTAPDAVILLVDDHEEVRATTAALLRAFGYHVLEADGADTAMALVRTLPRLDLLVTDVLMPETPGPALAAALRGLHPHLPVLFVTGYGGGEALAGESVLMKPFTDQALAGAVRRKLVDPRPSL